MTDGQDACCAVKFSPMIVEWGRQAIGNYRRDPTNNNVMYCLDISKIYIDETKRAIHELIRRRR